MTLCEELADRDQGDQPIRIGWVGSGDFGRGMQLRAHRISGLHPAIIADLDTARAASTFATAGRGEEDIVLAETLQEANDAIRLGKAVVTSDKHIVCESCIDVVVEVTGIPETAAQVAEMAIDHGKHIVMVTVEADCTVGTVLRQRADRASVVYTIADGDQPGNLTEFVRWARTLGFEVVAAGKGTKFYPHHRRVLGGRKERQRRQDREYDDGTKTFVELCSTANATGLCPDLGGPHLPTKSLPEIPAYFRPQPDGGSLHRDGVIDAVDCLDADGVTLIEPRLVNGTWIVVAVPEADREYMSRYLSFTTEDQGHGVLYRPHHLCGGEANMSVIKAAICGEATGAPRDERCADVIAVAKADLAAGTLLKGMGSAEIRGDLVDASEALKDTLLPAAMAENVRLLQDVPQGTRLSYAMVEPPTDSTLWALRAEQDIQQKTLLETDSQQG